MGIDTFRADRDAAELALTNVLVVMMWIHGLSLQYLRKFEVQVGHDAIGPRCIQRTKQTLSQNLRVRS